MLSVLRSGIFIRSFAKIAGSSGWLVVMVACSEEVIRFCTRSTCSTFRRPGRSEMVTINGCYGNNEWLLW